MNNGNWPFGLVDDFESIEWSDLDNIDMLLGFNTGDAFQWTNDRYPMLNRHHLFQKYDEMEVMEDAIQNDYLKQFERTELEELELLLVYGADAEESDDYYREGLQIPLRETLKNYFNDQGFLQRVTRAAEVRDSAPGVTFVYKFGVESWNTDQTRPLMVNSPKPWFAGAVRNDEAEYVFKFFGSFPTNRNYDESTMHTQDTISRMWATFIKEGTIGRMKQYRDGHCLVTLNYNEILWMDCDYRKSYINLWNDITNGN